MSVSLGVWNEDRKLVADVPVAAQRPFMSLWLPVLIQIDPSLDGMHDWLRFGVDDLDWFIDILSRFESWWATQGREDHGDEVADQVLERTANMRALLETNLRGRPDNKAAFF